MEITTSHPLPDADFSTLASLAPRAGETSSLFDQLDAGTASFGHRELDAVFRGTFNEKDRSYSWPKGESINTPRGRAPLVPASRNPKGGDREVRQIPFEKDSFRDICNAFFVHASISKAVSRADIPLFSRIDMTISQDGNDSKAQPAIGLCPPNTGLFSSLTHSSIQLPFCEYVEE